MGNPKLESELLYAHKKRDFVSLSNLYLQLAFELEASHDVDAACFYWTHSFVYGLEAGLEEATAIAEQKLAAYGRL